MKTLAILSAVVLACALACGVDPKAPFQDPIERPIPPTTITMKVSAAFKAEDGAIEAHFNSGDQLEATATRGLYYVVRYRRGAKILIYCDDAWEAHPPFSSALVRRLYATTASAIRAEGIVPTNERIIAKAARELDARRQTGDAGALEALVGDLERTLLLNRQP